VRSIKEIKLNDRRLLRSQSPSHVYSDAGMYTAILTVSDDDGAIGTDNVTIVVNKLESPVAAVQ